MSEPLMDVRIGSEDEMGKKVREMYETHFRNFVGFFLIQIIIVLWNSFALFVHEVKIWR